MSGLTDKALIVEGGCHCKAIRYRVHIPSLNERPTIIEGKRTINVPLISLDHCDSCRKASGVFLQCWFIIPQTWVKLSLLSKSKSAGNEYYLVTYRDGDKTEQGQISLADALTGEAGITDKTWLAHYESSEDAHRTFCSRCGTNLTFFWTGEMKPDYTSRLDITVGSLDKEFLAVPGLQPDRHGWWEDRVPWVEHLLTKGDEQMPGFKNPGGIKHESKAE